MHIRLVAMGSHGDVVPFIALAFALVSRGHDIVLAAPASFEEMATRAGVPFHGLGTRDLYEQCLRAADLWRPVRGITALFSQLSVATQQTYDWLVHESLNHDIVVVASSLSLGARVVEDKLALRVITVHASPILVESRHASPLLPGLSMRWMTSSRFRHWLGRGAERFVLGPAALPSLNALRSRLDLPAVRRLRHWWNSPSRVVLMFPAWYAPPQADWLPQAKQAGFPASTSSGHAEGLERDLSAFLMQGPAPLVFTYGTAMRQGKRFFETAIAVCRRMNRRGILLAAAGDQVPSGLPEGVIHRPYVPLSLLLPRSAALIHHGGIGTLTQALAAGIPQLIVPMAFDQFDNGDRVRRLGVGLTLSPNRFTPARAARCLNRLLLSPQVAQRCRNTRALMAREDGVSVACDYIEAAES